jgi:WD40 repeat protein
VLSGSDDGNFFIWNKQTGKLVNILHGDEDVVNVMEGHPFLPMLAVSGIDDSVKIFEPVQAEESSLMGQEEFIVRQNERLRIRGSRETFITRSMLARLAHSLREEYGVQTENAECIIQ